MIRIFIGENVMEEWTEDVACERREEGRKGRRREGKEGGDTAVSNSL